MTASSVTLPLRPNSIQNNVLVDEQGRARLTDFFVSAMMQARNEATSTLSTGSTAWIAPEQLAQEDMGIPEDQAGLPTKKSDMYAWAVTTWEVYICSAFISVDGLILLQVYSGKTPFAHLRIGRLVNAVVAGVRPTRPTNPSMDDLTWDSMQDCWSQQPYMRPSVIKLKPSSADTARQGTSSRLWAYYHVFVVWIALRISGVEIGSTSLRPVRPIPREQRWPCGHRI
jgi:serine/threonine protein kinase